MNREPEHITDEDWEARVSSWVDGHDQPDTADLDSPYGRQLWDTYHLIGDVMRSSDLAICPSAKFYARVAVAIDSEPSTPVARPLLSRPGVRSMLSSLAVAASVAAVTWYMWPGILLDEPPAAGGVTRLASLSEPAPKGALLADYVNAHAASTGLAHSRLAAYGTMGQ